MADLVDLHGSVPVHHMKWEHIETPYVLRGIEVHIYLSFEQDCPEYEVVLMDTYESWNVVAHIPRNAPDALGLARKRAEEVYDIMSACELTWVDRGLMTEAVNHN